MDVVTDQDLPIDGLEMNDDGSVDIPVDNPLDIESEFQANLAETVDNGVLLVVAADLIDAIDRDKQARSRRDKQYEEGLRRTGLGDDAPGGADFEGASDAVHPVMAEACVDFAARAIKELFPPQGPVKTSVIGSAPEAQLDRADRKRTFMNWQLTTQMPEYYSELEQLLTQLPLGGSQFQKFTYDTRFKRPTSEFVPIDDILIPFSAKSFYTSPRVTHVQHITADEFKQRIDDGLYRDISVSLAPGLMPERSASAEANDKIEGKEEDAYNEDGLRDIYEVYCWQDLGDVLVDEGALAPYIITIDAYEEKILSVYRNWKEDDETLEKLDWIVEWKFIPWRGAYAVGFPQLIGSLSAAATGSLRALLDSAHINNLPGLVKLKANKTNGQNIDLNATGITDIEGPAGIDDIRKLLMAIPFNQPSPILFQLLGWLTEAAKGVVSTAEGAIANVGDRTPVGTTQAMIEQGSHIYSAIHARLHVSQKKALQILCRINGTFLDEETEIEDLGKLIIRREDFVGSYDVIPVSDPAIFSEAQRFAQMQSVNQMQAQDVQDPSIPWNKIAVRRRALKLMRIDNIDEILPPPPKPITSDPMSEMMAVFQGTPIKAQPQQNHEAHINAHLLYLSNPAVLNNPLVQGQPLMVILGHVNEHMMFRNQQQIAQMTQQIMSENFDTDQDSAVSAAIEQMAQQIAQDGQPLLQRISELQQTIQAKMPPPQLPPEVQASIQIAQMDTQRRAQLDQATIQLKQVEAQAKNGVEQQRIQLDTMQQQFDQMIERQRVAMEEQNNRLTAQVDLMNNKADNQQKQMTELLKNRDDNATKLEIEMRKGFDELRAQIGTPPQGMGAAQPAQTDITPHLEKLQSLLTQMNQDKTNDALATVVQGLQATLQTLSQPRRTVLERDERGNPIGATSTLG